MQPQSLGITHSFFLEEITEKLAIPLNDRVSIPFTATCYVGVFVIALFVAHYTKFGRSIYALGGDEQSATLRHAAAASIAITVWISVATRAAAGRAVFDPRSADVERAALKIDRATFARRAVAVIKVAAITTGGGVA